MNLVSIFRCSSSPHNPVYVSHIDPSGVAFSLSLYRHTHVFPSILTLSVVHNKINFITNHPWIKCRSGQLTGLGIPVSMDHRGHKSRLDWLFTTENTETLVSDLNPESHTLWRMLTWTEKACHQGRKEGEDAFFFLMEIFILKNKLINEFITLCVCLKC